MATEHVICAKNWLGGDIEQLGEIFFADIIDKRPHQKAVVERAKGFVIGGQFVGRGDQGLQRHGLGVRAVVKNPLVENGQQGVENRRTGFENLVQKRDVDGQQIASELCA